MLSITHKGAIRRALKVALRLFDEPYATGLISGLLMIAALTLLVNYEIEAAGLFTIAAVLSRWHAPRQEAAPNVVPEPPTVDDQQRDFDEVSPGFAPRLDLFVTGLVDRRVRDQLAEFIRRERTGYRYHA